MKLSIDSFYFFEGETHEALAEITAKYEADILAAPFISKRGPILKYIHQLNLLVCLVFYYFIFKYTYIDVLRYSIAYITTCATAARYR